MKKLIVIVASVFLWRTAAHGCPQDASKPQDSPLVKAAKASGGPKKKSTKKVITNADVKKAGGKLTVLPDSKATVTVITGPQKSPLVKQEEQRRAADAAAKHVALAETKVAHLESDLASIEQSYYESNDPSERDTNIKKQFVLKKQQLDGARKELAEARNEQQRLTPTPPKTQ